jgi:RNA polymerase sigma factor (sigma-70 family)
VTSRTVEAARTLERIEAMSPEEQKRWLRRMLVNTLRDEIERWRTAGRNVGREQSLDEAAEQSSARLRDWIAAEESTRSGSLIKQEEKLRVLAALSQLPERERQALILQRYHGWTLAQIAEHLGCTISAAAGLHAHGVMRLRQVLNDFGDGEE